MYIFIIWLLIIGHEHKADSELGANKSFTIFFVSLSEQFHDPSSVDPPSSLLPPLTAPASGRSQPSAHFLSAENIVNICPDSAASPSSKSLDSYMYIYVVRPSSLSLQVRDLERKRGMFWMLNGNL